MKGFVNVYYSFALWITKMAYLNILWIVFTLLGLVVFGLFPATAGMFEVIRKWNSGEKEIDIFRTFWGVYRKEFFKLNLIGSILFILTYFLSIQFQILRQVDDINYFIASYVVLVMFLVICIVLLYIFPIYVHFNLRILENLKWSVVIGIIHPILTIFLMVSVVFLNYITFMFIPGLLFFFGGSVTAFILMWGVSQTFEKYEEKAVAS